MKHDKRFWQALCLAVPLLVLAAVIMYAESVIVFFEETVYGAKWEEKVTAVQRLGHKVKELVDKGYDTEEDRQFLEDTVITAINVLDLEFGVFAVTFDQNLNLTSYSQVDDPQEIRPMTSPDFKDSVYQALGSGASSGYLEVPWDNGNLELYFQGMPAENPIMWSVVGVSKEKMLASLNIRQAELPVFLAGLFLIGVFEALVYITLRERK